jgi:hypothetical protein
VSAGLGGAIAACLLVMVLARGVAAVRARFGAVERGLYRAAIAWFAMIAVACATGAR